MAERRLIDCGGVIDGLLGWEKGKVSASNQGSAASSATFWIIHQERSCDSSDRSARKPAIDGCVRVPMCAYMPAALLADDLAPPIHTTHETGGWTDARTICLGGWVGRRRSAPWPPPSPRRGAAAVGASCGRRDPGARAAAAGGGDGGDTSRVEPAAAASRCVAEWLAAGLGSRSIPACAHAGIVYRCGTRRLLQTAATCVRLPESVLSHPNTYTHTHSALKATTGTAPPHKPFYPLDQEDVIGISLAALGLIVAAGGGIGGGGG